MSALGMAPSSNFSLVKVGVSENEGYLYLGVLIIRILLYVRVPYFFGNPQVTSAPLNPKP